jgi:Na+/phosphate symporter
LLPLLLLHSLRHLGLMFLAPGAIYPGIPPQFTHPAAYGDLITAILAMIAIPAVAARARRAKLLVWLFNVVGSVDLVDAIVLATVYDAAPFMGPAYWIPAVWVPALLVTHYLVFVILLRGRWPAQ